MIGVVQQIDIAFLYAIAKGIAHRLHSEGHGADMHRDVVRLRHQPRFGFSGGVSATGITGTTGAGGGSGACRTTGSGAGGGT